MTNTYHPVMMLRNTCIHEYKQIILIIISIIHANPQYINGSWLCLIPSDYVQHNWYINNDGHDIGVARPPGPFYSPLVGSNTINYAITKPYQLTWIYQLCCVFIVFPINTPTPNYYTSKSWSNWCCFLSTNTSYTDSYQI